VTVRTLIGAAATFVRQARPASSAAPRLALRAEGWRQEAGLNHTDQYMPQGYDETAPARPEEGAKISRAAPVTGRVPALFRLVGTACCILLLVMPLL
jgi:hypothetical protein